jgi:hypothetical protein
MTISRFFFAVRELVGALLGVDKPHPDVGEVVAQRGG